MEVELTPEQPEPVVRAVEAALEAEQPAPDPWWQSGIEEALDA